MYQQGAITRCLKVTPHHASGLNAMPPCNLLVVTADAVYGKPNGQKMKNSVFHGEKQCFSMRDSVFHFLPIRLAISVIMQHRKIPEPIFHQNVNGFVLGIRIHIDSQNKTFALPIPTCWYLADPMRNPNDSL